MFLNNNVSNNFQVIGLARNDGKMTYFGCIVNYNNENVAMRIW